MAALSSGAKWTIGIVLFLLLAGGGTWAIIAASRRNKRKQSCMDKGLEGADLDACMKELKDSGQNGGRSRVETGNGQGGGGFSYGGQSDDPVIEYKPNVNNGATIFNNMMTGGGGSGSGSGTNIPTGTSVFPLKYGSRGAQVKAVQKAHNHQFPSDRITVDGIWGNATEKRAKALLAKVGLTGKPQISKSIYDKWFKRFE